MMCTSLAASLSSSNFQTSNPSKMAKIQSILFYCMYLTFQLFSLSVKSDRPLAPALYIFGDSLLDSGNNNFLETLSKANFPPYGIDFPQGTATGRYTNGKTVADFIAESLGLPYVPPYLGLSEGEKGNTLTGVNYASGSSGILPETGLGNILSLEDQVELFRQTLVNDLPNNFKSSAKKMRYLANSIFLITSGSNDYLFKYLLGSSYLSLYTSDQFAARLVDGFKKRVTKLYSFGARKFVLVGLGPIGCLPAIVKSVNPNATCIEAINNDILMFNTRFSRMIQELKSTLPQSTFVLGDFYNKIYDMNVNPIEYGFTEGQTPCCRVGLLSCLPNLSPCADRSKTLYYDDVHPTEAVNADLATACFNGSSHCIPINIQKLALK